MRKKVSVSVLNMGTTSAGMETMLYRWMQSMGDKYIFDLSNFMPSERPIPANRNHIVKKFLKTDNDILYMQDDDNPPLQNPFELIKYDKDVIAVPTPGNDKIGIKWMVFQFGDEYPKKITYKSFPTKDRHGLQQVDAISTGCLEKGTLILDENRKGIKIEDIGVGDYVLNHLGDRTVVEAISKRKYKGKIYKIKPHYFTKEITITPEHPILCYSKEGGLSFKNPTELSQKKDFLVFPLPKVKETDVKSMLVSDFVKGYKTEKGFIFSQYSHRNGGRKKVTFDYLSKKHGINWSVFQTVNSREKKSFFDRHKTEKEFNEIKGILKKEGYKNDLIKIKNKIAIDDDLMWLFGIYLAEGFSYKSTIEFSLSSEEWSFCQRICKIMEKKFNLKGKISIRGSVSRVRFNNIIIAKFFDNLFGKGARKKEIDKFLLGLPAKKLKILINGFIDGDGHRRKEFTSCFTTSTNLALQIRDIYLRLGKLVGLRYKKKNISYINGRKIFGSGGYTITKYNESRKSRFGFIDNSYCYIKLFRLKSSPFSGFVYNLQTRDENTYCLNGFSVHNCIFIQRKVLEKIKRPFEDIFDKDGCIINSDDMAFADKCKRAGFEEWTHFDYYCSHYKTVDLLRMLQMIQKAHQAGFEEGKKMV